ncbi:ankyrin repeat domain-containing protein [Aureibaculum marinum]|uniref:Ankyrin repeat domain-containing protein n=1 Tax=Aureibaculum marinum TaxID=2487930 RepID=A0A3N4N501_9FLAO|nr:ankyrin repeat domain-containing protein [Aureibaculum marinum]RPD91201.1 ankyrin repeat domain-containing protein [Aureibaculum marinum]
MKKLITLTILLVASTITAQDSNIFWNRDFWKPTVTLKKVQEQIKAGNNATTSNPNNFDATVYAILGNAPDNVIKYLLSLEGNDVNKITHDGRTYLFWAAMKGNISIMKYLIDNGAKTDVIDDKGSSVLLFAAGGGQTNPKLYNLLLANGATINETNPKGANALHQLIGKVKTLNELDYFINKGLKLSDIDKAGLNTIDYAARSGNKDIIEQLIKKGISYKDTNTDGGNAFLEAATIGRGGGNNLAFFKYLESLGINPNITNKQGINPIHKLAAGNKNVAIFDYFIEKGVDPTKADNEGNTALINSAGRNSLDVITYFLSKNVTINAKNKEGKSALTNAVANNSLEAVAFLINKGADINVIDKNNNNLAYYLITSYSKRNKKQFEEKWNLLAKKGLNMLHLQKENNTILHLAVTKNDTDLLDKISNLKVDVNAKNSNGLTALHIAAMTATDTKIIKHLIELGANPTVLTDFEESPYDLALENEFLDKKEIEFLKL